MKLKGGLSSTSFDVNDVRKVNLAIALRSRRMVDTHVGDCDVNLFPPISSTLLLSNECDSRDVPTF